MTISTYSHRAYESIKPVAPRIEAEVLCFIQGRGVDGSTSDECEAALGLTHQCCSARFNQLAKLGVITLSGEARKTRSGRKAGVYVVASLVKANA